MYENFWKLIDEAIEQKNMWLGIYKSNNETLEKQVAELKAENAALREMIAKLTGEEGNKYETN
jgi:cell division protein FtsB